MLESINNLPTLLWGELMGFRGCLSAILSLMVAVLAANVAYGAPNEKRIQGINYTKKNHDTCQKRWPAPCGSVNDKNGETFLCLSQPKHLTSLSDACLGVVMEIANWAPTACTATKMKQVCPGFEGAFARLDCAAFRANSFGAPCALWTEAAGRVVKEYRQRTGITN